MNKQICDSKIAFAGMQKTTLSDYPGKIAAMVFTKGCNFNCPYCHNPQLLSKSSNLNKIDEKDVLEFLHKRKNVIDGLVVSGGEPTLQPGLPDFLLMIKTMGLHVKLDTNGSRPEILKILLAANLVDYVAMDIKAPLSRYCEVAGVKECSDAIADSIELIQRSSVTHEFRTTAVKSLLEQDDLLQIGTMLSRGSTYVLQPYRNDTVLDEKWAKGATTFTNVELEMTADKLKKNLNCRVR